MSPVLPPRRAAGSRATFRADSSPLQILLQMGFSKHRALKALAATGNRSVQLASDWLLTHVNDTTLDAETPREYILYACPTGALLSQLHAFWEKSKAICGWNGAHNYPPHITLVSFFKAPDDCSLQLGKALKHVVETVGYPPDTFLKLEPYISHNFMGLFVCEEHADYFKRIALQYVKQVSSAMGLSVDTYDHLDALATCFPWCAVPHERPLRSISLEPHVKSLHITLAYQFPMALFTPLKQEVELMQPLANSCWELRLYSRDSKFQSHLVHKVTQVYAAQEPDELELVLGDYVYIDEVELKNSTDGWVQGTSWLTGVSGQLPAVYTVRTAESDAWTLHRVMSLANSAQSSECKWESDSATEGEVGGAHAELSVPVLGLEKSEESFQEWHSKYMRMMNQIMEDVFITDPNKETNGVNNTTNGTNTTADAEQTKEEAESGEDSHSRWILSMRHGERVDMTYGSWIPFCFDDNDQYCRKDLNMPLSLPEREGGKWSFDKDSPLTRVGELQAYLVGEGLRQAGVTLSHVYSSPALRSVQTSHHMLRGLNQTPPVKIRIEPGLFEYMTWHTKGIATFMTPIELHKAGYDIDLSYTPYVELTENLKETVEEYYGRGEKVTHGAYRDTEAEGGNMMFVGHSCTLDTLWQTLRRYDNDSEHPPYALSRNLMRVPYCAVSAMLDRPCRLVPPPCPPSINTSSGRFDWKMILHV